MTPAYEQIGLPPSIRKDDCAYRLYDGEALRRLRRIEVMRDLRFSLQGIRRMLAGGRTVAAIERFARHLWERRDPGAPEAAREYGHLSGGDLDAGSEAAA